MTDAVSPSVENASPGAEPVWVPDKVNQRPVNFTDETYLEHLKGAMARGLPMIEGPSPVVRRETLVICGNGPSLARSTGELKRLAKAGHKIVACNNAYEFLKRRGVPVWAQAAMDASPNTARYFEHRDPIGYILCSLCHPDVFDAVKGRQVLLWHTQHSDECDRAAFEAFPGQPIYVIAGGCTIALRMIHVGYTMGFRAFRLFGVDSCFEGDRQYAAPRHVYEGVIKTRIGGPGGKEFQTSPQMQEQVLSFQQLIKRAVQVDERTMLIEWPLPNALVAVHGEGLLVELLRVAWAKEKELADVG